VSLKFGPKPACELKIVPKAGYECTVEKSTNESKGKLEQRVMRLTEQFLEIVSVFKEASKKFILIFLLY
jgi:hypothetical protein